MPQCQDTAVAAGLKAAAKNHHTFPSWMKEQNNIQVLPSEIHWHPRLPIYASEAFLKTVGDEYGWLGGFDNVGSLRCILPFTLIKKTIFRLVRFYMEPLPTDGELSLSEEKSFLNNAVSHFKMLGANLILPATANAIFRVYPDGATAAPYGTFRLDLFQPKDVLWENLHPKHRNVIRSAQKNGVTVQIGAEELKTAGWLIRETLHRSHLGFLSDAAFQRQVASLGDNVKIMVARHNGVPQGCAVIPFSEHGAYYLYGGSIPHPVTGALNLLQWEAIQQFHQLGVRHYDFVGARLHPERNSKQHGLRMFKERFGGEFVTGYLWKYSLNRLANWAYSLAVRTLRGGDIVDQEKHTTPPAKSVTDSLGNEAGVKTA